MKMLLAWKLLQLALQLCTSSSVPGCLASGEKGCQDETSLLQVTQNVVLSAERQQKASTTPSPFGTSKFGAAGKASKVKLNSAGDILLFEAACKTNIGAFVFFCIISSFLIRSCPEMMCWRSICGYDKAKEKDAPESWYKSHWTMEEIEDLPDWEDGLDENGETIKIKPVTMFRKRNNWPAPKAARFDPEDLVMSKKEGWTNWVKASLNVDFWAPDVHEAIGVDCAMLIVYTELALKILMIVGGGSVIFLAPMFIYGGGGAAKKDVLSWQGVGNVWYVGNAETLEEQNYIDDVQWVWYVLALYTWFAVITTMQIMWEFHERFLKVRKHWLRAMPPPQSRTMLVELMPLPAPALERPDPTPETGDDVHEDDDIYAEDEDAAGQEYWDDEYLKAFFDKLFPDQIESVYVIRKATELIASVNEYAQAAPGGTDEELLAIRERIQEHQEDLKERQEERPKDYYSCNGFVTFKTTHDRDAALYQKINDTEGEFELSNPPLPNDIIFGDLETDAEDRAINDRFGDGLVVMLFMTFMPIVLFIGAAASLQNIESVPAIKKFLKSNKLEATVGGVLASLGLTIMMSMLPTFLMMIYELYTLKSVQWRQLELQRWYYWFLVLFVLLVTCVGSDLEGTLMTLAHKPFGIFSLLANRMPLTTHFYLNYTIMQVLTHGMGLTRYINLMKYYLWQNAGYGRPGGGRSEDARFKSEPEDQDYYGIGSRSARFSFMLTAGLVYGTICPLMNFTVGCNFIACRIVYGYLIPCVEMRKNDIGGEHWVLAIKQTSQGLLIYIILQVGIIANRAESHLPSTLAALSFFFWYHNYCKLGAKRWYALSLYDIMVPEGKDVVLRKSILPSYTQNLEDVYTVPWDGGKGGEVWVKHYASLP